MDGKHVAIRKPGGSGSLYFNYKKFFSVVLFAMCDANYKFLYCDFGNYGSASDGGIFDRSDLNYRMLSGLNLPPPEPLPNTTTSLPYFVFGDCAFPLRCELMKPFPVNHGHNTTIFNYRLYLFIRFFIPCISIPCF